jgi:hypothetical protein
LGRRRIARFGVVWREKLVSIVPSYFKALGGAGRSEAEYHKLETTEST